MRVGAILDLSEDDLRRVTTIAARLGFLREDSRRAWTEKDYRAAVRYVAQRLVADEIGKER